MRKRTITLLHQPSWSKDIYVSKNDTPLLYRFRTEQGHCGACRRKWQLTDTDLCLGYYYYYYDRLRHHRNII